MTSRKRENGGYWYNDQSIASVHHALYLLERVFGDSGDRYLARERDTDSVVLCRNWYREGDSGGDTSGVYYYEIDPVVVENLRTQQLVEHKRVPYMGGSYTDEDKFVLSPAGIQELKRLNTEMEEVTRELLTASKLAPSNIESISVRNRSWKNEVLYFELEAEEEERFKVSPALKTVERLEEKRIPPKVVHKDDAPLSDGEKILRRLEHSEGYVSFISAPNELRVDVYGKKQVKDGPAKHVIKEIRFYDIDPAAVVMLLWEGLLSGRNEIFQYEPKPKIQYGLSERGYYQLRGMK